MEKLSTCIRVNDLASIITSLHTALAKENSLTCERHIGIQRLKRIDPKNPTT